MRLDWTSLQCKGRPEYRKDACAVADVSVQSADGPLFFLFFSFFFLLFSWPTGPGALQRVQSRSCPAVRTRTPPRTPHSLRRLRPCVCISSVISFIAFLRTFNEIKRNNKKKKKKKKKEKKKGMCVRGAVREQHSSLRCLPVSKIRSLRPVCVCVCVCVSV